jgi:hypothetical protein
MIRMKEKCSSVGIAQTHAYTKQSQYYTNSSFSEFLTMGTIIQFIINTYHTILFRPNDLFTFKNTWKQNPTKRNYQRAIHILMIQKYGKLVTYCQVVATTYT